MSDSSGDLTSHTANRMAELGADHAKDMARRKLIGQIKQYLPRFLWPLIPGQGGTVQGNLEKMAKRKVSNILWGIGCTVGFFLIFGGLVAVFGAVIAYAVMSST